MNTNNADKSSSWKNWIIKKLLSNDSTKEDILNFIANDEDDKDLEDLNDNNEKNLIKNIVNLNEKSVEDLMIPRSEIIAIDHDKSYNEILEDLIVFKRSSIGDFGATYKTSLSIEFISKFDLEVLIKSLI